MVNRLALAMDSRSTKAMWLITCRQVEGKYLEGLA